MRIAILSRGPKLYSTRRLKQACRDRGHEAVILDPMRFAIEVEQGSPDLFYGARRVRRIDAVIPRIGASVTFFGTAVVRQFEQMGVFSVNPSHAISVSRDKLRSIQVLSRHQVGFPRTTFVKDRTSTLAALERIGVPAVLKLLEGTQGIGVALAESPKVAEALVEMVQQAAKQNVLLQEYVAESRGRDLRALVVGGRVVAAMRRRARGEEFRSNVHRGGETEPVVLEKDAERVAIHAAQVLGLRFAGVDMLESAEGPKIIEVNSSPGLEQIEKTTGVDVAGRVVALIEEEVLFPEIDVRQRLSLSSGYGVMEFPIGPGSELAHRTIGEARLADRDVIVLSIQRDSVVLPVPRPDCELLPGDVLLCYGKSLTLRGLAPHRPARPRRRPRRMARAAAGPPA